MHERPYKTVESTVFFIPIVNLMEKNKTSWGWYQIIDTGERYKTKNVVLNPGESISLQFHYHRSEHWVVVAGTAKVVIDDKEFFLYENESTFVPQTSKHKLSNPGKIPLHIIEVQTGTCLEEEDIVRL